MYAAALGAALYFTPHTPGEEGAGLRRDWRLLREAPPAIRARRAAKGAVRARHRTARAGSRLVSTQDVARNALQAAPWLLARSLQPPAPRHLNGNARSIIINRPRLEEEEGAGPVFGEPSGWPRPRLQHRGRCREDRNARLASRDPGRCTSRRTPALDRLFLERTAAGLYAGRHSRLGVRRQDWGQAGCLRALLTETRRAGCAVPRRSCLVR